MAPSWLWFLEQPDDLCIPLVLYATVHVGFCLAPGSQSGLCVKPGSRTWHGSSRLTSPLPHMCTAVPRPSPQPVPMPASTRLCMQGTHQQEALQPL